MFKTILDKDLLKYFWKIILQENLISKAYKKIDTRRIGPGLMEFLEDSNIIPYGIKNFSLDSITEALKDFCSTPPITSTPLTRLANQLKDPNDTKTVWNLYGTNKKGGN